MGNRRVALLAIALLLWLSVAARAQGAADPQIEKGRAVVAQVCTTCHTTLGRMLQVHKQTREQWRDLVFFMISRGCAGHARRDRRGDGVSRRKRPDANGRAARSPAPASTEREADN
jgi:hypothetical protein